MSYLIFATFVGMLSYNVVLTQHLAMAQVHDAREMQNSLVLTRRVEELLRTRHGAINNAFVCHLRN